MCEDPLRRAIGRFVEWRDWDGEIVAYNDRTGDTHHLADLPAWVFRRLAAAPASAEEIIAAARDEIDLAANTDHRAALTRSIDLLERLGLLAAAP